MNKIRKLASLALALVMALALAAPAFASDPPASNTPGETFSITVENASETVSISGEIFNAYKLFDVTYNTGATAYSYTVSSEFAGFSYTADGKTYTGQGLVDYVASLSSKGDGSKELDEFARAAGAWAQTNMTPTKTVTAAKYGDKEKAVFDLAAPGYYLVTGSGKDEKGNAVAVACSLTTTNPDQVFNLKADIPTIDKKILEDNNINNTDPANEVDGTTRNVGDTVTFEITATVPDVRGYDKYTFKIHDTLSSGLTLNTNSATVGNTDFFVTIGGKTLTAGVDYTVTVTGQSIEIDFPDFYTLVGANNEHYAKGTEIRITYSATLNSGALTTDVETNTVKLEYSNKPGEDGTGTTEEKKVYVYDFDLVIDKYKTGEEDTKLAGAKFVLYRLNANGDKEYYVWSTANNDSKVLWGTATAKTDAQTGETYYEYADGTRVTEKVTGEDGAVSFQGLAAGTYYLEELAAPSGYNKLTEDVKITITPVASTDPDKVGQFTFTTEVSDQVSKDTNGNLIVSNGTITPTTGEQNKLTAGVANNNGSLLPSTGGIGTTIFYIVGGVLAAGAVILLITKRRMNIDKE